MVLFYPSLLFIGFSTPRLGLHGPWHPWQWAVRSSTYALFAWLQVSLCHVHSLYIVISLASCSGGCIRCLEHCFLIGFMLALGKVGTDFQLHGISNHVKECCTGKVIWIYFVMTPFPQLTLSITTVFVFLISSYIVHKHCFPFPYQFLTPEYSRFLHNFISYFGEKHPQTSLWKQASHHLPRKQWKLDHREVNKLVRFIYTLNSCCSSCRL